MNKTDESPSLRQGPTPGPWEVGVLTLCNPGNWRIVRTPNGMVAGNHICHVLGGRTSFVAERDANARLIAAAPELLQALKEILKGYCDAGSDNPRWRADQDDLVQNARAAIAKAERR